MGHPQFGESGSHRRSIPNLDVLQVLADDSGLEHIDQGYFRAWFDFR